MAATTARRFARATIVALTALLVVIFSESSADTAAANASTVVGTNPFLSDGAAALMNKDWARGIELTQLGLAGALSDSDRAIALANLCAGFAALKKYERALDSCNQSIAIYAGNWRAWQNRAAANIGLGRFDESLRDVERGLQVNPDSEALQKTLAIVRQYQKVQTERLHDLIDA